MHFRFGKDYMIKIYCAYGTKEIRELFYGEIEKNVKRKKQSYLLVPEQQVLAYEDESVRTLPPSAPLSFTVASFSLLSDIAQRKYGGLSYKMLSKPIKTLFMWRAIREMRPYLSVYGRMGIEGLTPAMIGCIDELKASGISPDDLADAKNFLADSPAFAGKIGDISLIYSAYKALCGSKYSDSNDSLAKLNAILKKHDVFSGCEFFVDSFTDFTPIQFSILEQLIRRADVSFAFPTDVGVETTLQFEDIRETYVMLRRVAEEYGIPIEVVRKESDINCASLKYIQDNVWRIDALPYSGPDKDSPIEIYSCPDASQEVALCVNLIKRAAYNGCSYGDIAIISRNPQRYEKMLAAAAAEAGIPLFTSDRTPLSDRVFVTYITSLLRIICNGWRREDVTAHLKCGLCRADADDVHRFELYTSRWSLSGKRQLCEDEFTAPYRNFDYRSESDEKYTESANKIREGVLLPILELEKRITKLNTAPEILKTVFEFLEYAGAREELIRLADELSDAGELREADQTARIYKTTVRLLDDVSFALGDDVKLDVSEACALLELLFASADIGSIPTRQNEVVLADASFYRSFGHRQVILIGCNDGAFPRSAKSSGILSTSEKERLRTEGLPFSSDACKSASREYLFFWRSISMAKERLILTFAEKNGSDGTGQPCSAIAKICYLDSKIKVRKLEDVIPELLYDAKSLLPFIASKFPKSELYEYLLSIVNDTSSNDKLTYNGGSLSYSHTIPTSDVDAVFGDTLYTSPTSLEKYNKCAFMYFCDKLLELDSGEPHRFNSRLSGNLVHKALEDYLNAVADNGGSADGINAGEICENAARAYYDEICPPHLRDNERIRIAFERTAINASILASYVAADMTQTEFTPMAYEYNTAASGGLVIDAKKRAVINGRIDRIDKAKSDGESYLRIIDYKTGSKEFSFENLENGTDLQLPLYLRAVTSNGNENPGGFLYLSSATPKITLNSASELEDTDKINSLILSTIGASGVLNSLFVKKKSAKLAAYTSEELNSLLDETEDVIRGTVNRIADGDFDASPACINKKYPCEYCAFAAICRRRRYSKD